MASYGELTFSMADLYGPAFGFSTTRNVSLPEEDDQKALVDDQNTAKKNPAHHDPKLSRNILIGIAIIGVVIAMFSIY